MPQAEVTKQFDLNNPLVKKCFQKIVPESAEKFADVTELYFKPRTVTTFPPGMVTANKLRVLSVANNKCATLPDIFDKFPHLTKLKLNDNKLKFIPPSVFTCLQLRELDISGNYISELPDLFKFSNLVMFNMSVNKISQLPESFYSMYSLQAFYAFFNALTELSSKISQLRNLKEVCLNWNKLKTIPPELFQLPDIEVCYVTHNKSLEGLKIENVQSHTLQHLDISKSNLNHFPKDIFNIRRLIEVSAGYNKISELPDEFQKLPTLVELSVPGNRLTSLPKSLGRCGHLVCLNVSMNRLESLPSELANARNLQEIKLNDNKIEELPDNFGQYQSLTKLDVSDNKIRELPDSIANAPSLTYLNASWNCIQKLPESLRNFRQLEILDVSNNALTELPVNIGEISRLEILDVASNQLKTIPVDILKLHNLKSINYEENRDLVVSDEFLDYIEEQFYQDLETGEVRQVEANSRKSVALTEDPQNTHRDSIRESAKRCVQILSKDFCEYTLEKVMADFRIDEQRKALMNFIRLQDRRKIYNLSIQDIVVRVWNRIKRHSIRQSRLEMIRLFHDAVTNDSVYCYSRRIADIVGVLQGYYDDIVIQISTAEQIQNIAAYIYNNKDKSEWLSCYNERMDALQISGQVRDNYEQYLREHLFE